MDTKVSTGIGSTVVVVAEVEVVAVDAVISADAVNVVLTVLELVLRSTVDVLYSPVVGVILMSIIVVWTGV